MLCVVLVCFIRLNIDHVLLVSMCVVEFENSPCGRGTFFQIAKARPQSWLVV